MRKFILFAGIFAMVSFFGFGSLLVVGAFFWLIYWLLSSAVKGLGERQNRMGEQYLTPFHSIGRFFRF